MLSGISIWQLLIILAIVVLLFGTKKLKNMGTDLGSAIRGFKQAVREGEGEDDENKEGEDPQLQGSKHQENREGTTIDQGVDSQQQGNDSAASRDKS